MLDNKTKAAILAWANLFTNVSDVGVLGDGYTVGAILKEIDREYFHDVLILDLPSKSGKGADFIRKLQLLKQISSRIEKYFYKVSRKSFESTPNVTLIASENDENEIVKLMTMVMVVSVTCDKNDLFINKIQTELDTENQAIFMGIVSAVIEEDHIPPQSPPGSDDREIELEEEISRLIVERERHNALYQELSEKTSALEQENEELKREKLSNSEKIVPVPTAPDFADTKEYIAELEAELRASQIKIAEQDKTIRELGDVVSEIPSYKSTIRSLENELAEKDAELLRLKSETSNSFNRKKSVSSLSEADPETCSRGSPEEVSMPQLDTSQLETARVLTENMNISDPMPELSATKIEDYVSQKRTADILEYISVLTQQLKDAKAQNESLDLEANQLQTELELVSSAWYSLASRVQQENTSVTKTSNQSPSGWLTKQRESMNRIF